MLDADQKLKEFNSLIKNAKSEREANEIKNVFSKNNLSLLYKELKNLPDTQRQSLGKTLNNLKQQINNIYDNYILNLQTKYDLNSHQTIANIKINTSYNIQGSFNPITIISNKIINFFKKMNFQIVHGNEVIDTKYNFDYLNFSLDHPGRLTSESFYFDPHTMLRAHNTASTAEQMHLQHNNKDLRVLSWGNVYRNDDDDLSHSHQFNQIDLVWIKDGLTLSNLKWLLTSFLQYLYGKNIKLRYRLSYFVFTEPSVEVDMECPICHGKGCSLCKKSGWIEIIGAGMLHQNVLKNAGFKITTGIAAGIGIDRLAMIKYGIKDIRDLYSNDFRFIDQFKGER